ncbi:MSHA biogenesis protein MshN [Vibrio penaeicida]|uniref:tetratricopeptide repeat protein n=1 Tax=Vibrio penaeicida TaxID=104609 RepID=UPI0027323136|nr:tetratricopeptide repeat protein [Vibrio penaeicida]MDP2572997.1 MSHA biogenesis protein MshN [Vibrio penaeicida]
MSVINKALSEMSDKKSPAGRIEKVDVSPVKKRPQAIWAVVFIALLVTGGSWFTLSQSTSDPAIAKIPEKMNVDNASDLTKPVTTVVTMEVASPTQQTVSESVANIYQDQATEEPEVSISPAVSPVSGAVQVANIESEKSIDAPKSESKPIVEQVVKAEKKQIIRKTEDPIAVPSKNAITPQKQFTSKKEVKPEKAPKVLLANASSIAETDTFELPPQPITDGEMAIQQVELTPQQLADKSLSRAKKSLDANDFDGAIKGYQSALRYVPKDEVVRKKLAALYYGRGNVRQSLEILQKGIVLDRDSQVLRLAAMNILVKEGINEAALGVLEHLPPNPEQDYLAARAGLAQQLKNYPIALESYQMLVRRDKDNGKWWLGLGIQQERSAQYSQAKSSYQKALNRVGLSAQTNSFIRERIAYINEREASSNAD